MTKPPSEIDSALLKAFQSIDWAKLAEGIAKALVLSDQPKRRIDGFCLAHGLNNPGCACGKPKAPRFSVMEGEATTAGKSEAPLRLVETPTFVVAKKEKTA